MNELTESDNKTQDELILRFSHNVLEHLGLKLYQNKPTNVLAELVSNSWDAYSEHVWIDLQTNPDGAPQVIAVSDDGQGMDEGTLKQNYLVVGKPKRDDIFTSSPPPKNKKSRPPMGRKGIGKLAPFGVAKEVDLISIRSGNATWLRFNYENMLNTESSFSTFSEYRPEVIYRNTPIERISHTKSKAGAEIIKKFLSRANQSGTIVLAHNLTLRRPITTTNLMESLGRRFTVTLAREDFKLRVNDIEVAVAEAECNTVTGLKQVHHAATPLPLS